MPRTIRFHLDENCTKAIAVGLRRHAIDVTTTPEAGLLGAIDEEHATYSLTQGRVIFTQDRDFLRIHAASVPHAGIAYCEKDTRSIGEILAALVLIWEIYEPAEMAKPSRVHLTDGIRPLDRLKGISSRLKMDEGGSDASLHATR